MEKMIRASLNHATIAIIGIGIVTPIFEEFVFRGLLFQRLVSVGSPLVAVFVTAFVFAILHMQYSWAIMLGVLCIGLVLGMLRWKSGSIWPCVLLHCLNNTIATLIAFNTAPQA
ncbi:MAG: CPBP family intramembrane metalloprotease [Flavobacteriales bacterium]|nr:CPBP family intramembrane metalloprotease [Flavobacteriales bacterium]